MENLRELDAGVTGRMAAPKMDTTKRGNLLRIGLIIGLVLLAVVAVGAAYIWLSGGTGQPSSPTTAPALILQPGDTRALFRVVPEESEARFIIEETLLGNPKTVVGATQQLAGEMLVDISNLSSAQIGGIRVNVNTLTTDNEFRNRAIRSQILQSTRPEYEFAEFIVQRSVGLPENAGGGDTLTFEIEGDLRLRDVTHLLIFDTTVQIAAVDRIVGHAQAQLERADFGLTIPEAPGVANVSETVIVEIDFVAEVASG